MKRLSEENNPISKRIDSAKQSEEPPEAADSDEDLLELYMASLSESLVAVPQHIPDSSYLESSDSSFEPDVDSDSDESADDFDPMSTNRRPGKIRALSPVDHAQVRYPALIPCSYEEHDEINSLRAEQVDELRKSFGISVSGRKVPRCICSFAHLGLPESLTDALSSLNFQVPTPIQAQAVPAALRGRDVIGIAETGSGKTIAYLIPALMRILRQKEEISRSQEIAGPIVVVVCPTRELAVQVERVGSDLIRLMRSSTNQLSLIRTLSLAGGLNKHEQIRLALSGKCELVVGTPGRLIDLIAKVTKRRFNFLHSVGLVVLDEADRMFSLGFGEQISSILSQIRPDRQLLLFSATMPSRVENLARDHMTDVVRVLVGTVGNVSSNVEVKTIRRVNKSNDWKFEWLYKALTNVKESDQRHQIDSFPTSPVSKDVVDDVLPDGRVIVFVNTRKTVDNLCARLSQDMRRRVHVSVDKAGNNCVVSLHGDMEQFERLSNLDKFRKGEARVLVCSDVASRGLDIPQVDSVVEFEQARDKDTQTHRVGRTGRAGRKGFAFILQDD